MTSDTRSEGVEDGDTAPADDVLQEPSTEKDPREEPKAKRPHDPEPDHEAVGIGVIGGELNDTDQTPPDS